MYTCTCMCRSFFMYTCILPLTVERVEGEGGTGLGESASVWLLWAADRRDLHVPLLVTLSRRAYRRPAQPHWWVPALSHDCHVLPVGTVMLNPNTQDSPSIMIQFKDYDVGSISYPDLDVVLEVASKEIDPSTVSLLFVVVVRCC